MPPADPSSSAWSARAGGWKSVTLHVVIGLIYIMVGALTMYDPVAATLSLTLFIAAMLLAVASSEP